MVVVDQSDAGPLGCTMELLVNHPERLWTDIMSHEEQIAFSGDIDEARMFYSMAEEPGVCVLCLNRIIWCGPLA